MSFLNCLQKEKIETKKQNIFIPAKKQPANNAARFFVGIIVFVVMLFPVAKVFAAAFITLDSFSGHPGVVLHVSGGGYTPGETVSIYLGSMGGSPVATAIAGADSLFPPVNVTVPANTPQGPLAVIAVGNTTGTSQSNSYYVTSFTPSLTAADSPNTPGSTVLLAGNGFAPGETVNFVINGSMGGHVIANGSGNFSVAPYVIPSLASGVYQLHGVGASSGADTIDYFYIGGFYPSAYPTTYYLLPGQSVGFSGSGFGAGETIQVFSNGSTTPISSLVAGSDGSFSSAGTYMIPVSAHAGIKTFVLKGATTHVESSGIMITVGSFNANINPSAFWLMPGATLDFSGNGFAGSESIQVTVGSSPTPVAEFNANSSGSFTNLGHIVIPFSFSGTTKTFHVKGLSSNTGGDVDITVGGFFPTISPSAYWLTPGQNFTISGTGFAPGETVSITGNGTTVNIPTDILGNFLTAGPFTAPVTGSSISVTAYGLTSSVSAGPLSLSLGSLSPSVSPSNYYLTAGSNISFTGTGFLPNETVAIINGTSHVGSVMATSSGAFTSGEFTIPFSSSGSQVYTFTGNTSNAAATVAVTIGAVHPYADADSYYATSGSTIHVQGHGFALGEGVTVTGGSSPVHVVADSSGQTSPIPVTLPFGASPVIFTLTGDSSGASAAVPVTLAPFSPQVNPDTWYTAPGTIVHFTGNGFAAGETVTASLNGSVAGSVSATASGSFDSLSVSIPVSAQAAHVVFTGSISHASAAVDVGLSAFSPQITPSTWYAPAGSNVSFAGTGFAAGESVAIIFNGSSAGTATVNSGGGFTSGNIQIPFSATSSHFVFTSSLTHVTQTIDIGVAALHPGIVLSTYYDQGGSPFTVTGMGFGGSEVVNISFDGSTLGSPTTDNSGNFVFTTTVPFGPAGNVSVQARGASSGVITDPSNFTRPQVYVNAQLGSYAGAPGDAVTFIGSGFLPSEPVTVTTDRTGATTVHSFNADAGGNFNNNTYHVPLSFTGGPLTFTITGAHSFSAKNIMYYVTGP